MAPERNKLKSPQILYMAKLMVKELLIDILRTRIAENYIRENYKYNEMKKIQTIYRSLESRLYCEVDRKIVEEFEIAEN